jgi:ribosomal protein S18 acetylase RimI-like enzyme
MAPVMSGPVDHPQITLAIPADRHRVVSTFVAAFAADPAVRYFFPDDGAYPAQAATFAGYLFDKRVGVDGVHLADGGAAVALWDPPGGTSTVDALELPADAQQRLDAYDAIVHHYLPSTPHWYLGVLATHPEHTGRRLGRAVMATGVERAHAAGLPAYLETSNARNVDVYRGAGFEVVGEASIVDLHVWVMANPVRA